MPARTFETVLHNFREKLRNRRRGDRDPNVNTHTHTLLRHYPNMQIGSASSIEMEKDRAHNYLIVGPSAEKTLYACKGYLFVAKALN